MYNIYYNIYIHNIYIYIHYIYIYIIQYIYNTCLYIENHIEMTSLVVYHGIAHVQTHSSTIFRSAPGLPIFENAL